MEGREAEYERQRDARKQLYDSSLLAVLRGLVVLHGLIDFMVADHDGDQRQRVAHARPEQVEVDLPGLQRVFVVTQREVGLLRSTVFDACLIFPQEDGVKDGLQYPDSQAAHEGKSSRSQKRKLQRVDNC